MAQQPQPAAADEPQTFRQEAQFEDALVAKLQHHGWQNQAGNTFATVLNHPTEADLVDNWRRIIYAHNRRSESLDSTPLSEGEMRQILNKMNECRTPYAICQFVQSGKVTITRDASTAVAGRQAALDIFSPDIISGRTVYQIARQPRFTTRPGRNLGTRRGDLTLLIDGLPLIHIELKRHDSRLQEAADQIKRYAAEGVFATGIFSLVHIFVAMTPGRALYFANPGAVENYRPDFRFGWTDHQNYPVNQWADVVRDLLNIPMAHRMVSTYSIADSIDSTLKVMRPYQVHAAEAIENTVKANDFNLANQRGGYIWHTTGSGKTLTSFKTAQILADKGLADKVVFLLDRIELAGQSYESYRGFAPDDYELGHPDNADQLVRLLRDKATKLVIASIQKFDVICRNDLLTEDGLRARGINNIVFIVDECHRSTGGEMLRRIEARLPHALLFGFTGTPIFAQTCQKGEINTEAIFGNRLHKYTVANAIPDGNVLDFNINRVTLHADDAVRDTVVRHELHTDQHPILTDEQINEIADPDRRRDEERRRDKRNDLMNLRPMADELQADGTKLRGIESMLPTWYFRCEEHHRLVIRDIKNQFPVLSSNGRFHAILATKSIQEAIEYFDLIRDVLPQLHLAPVFDNNIDNSDGGIAREEDIARILDYYNLTFHTNYDPAHYNAYKKDVRLRLAHRAQYDHIECNHEACIDLLIVVTQLLTGYDSKWVNTLYVDKTMDELNVMQSFSRTNRVFNHIEKPYGIIRYYTKPYTMEQVVDNAIKLYMDKKGGTYKSYLPDAIREINDHFRAISDIFARHQIVDFSTLPPEDAREDRYYFANRFREMTRIIVRSKYEGFTWAQTRYTAQGADGINDTAICEINKPTYDRLHQRYKDLFARDPDNGGTDREEPDDDFYYPEDPWIMAHSTIIDADYINSRFRAFIELNNPRVELTPEAEQALAELHRVFAVSSQEDQQTLDLVIADIRAGNLRPEPDKSIYDYIELYKELRSTQPWRDFADATGLDYERLAAFIRLKPTEGQFNQSNRYNELRATANADLVQAFIAKVGGAPGLPPMVAFDGLLRDFILHPETRRPLMNKFHADKPIDEEAIRQKIVKEMHPELDIDALKAVIADKCRADFACFGQKVDFDAALAGLFRFLDAPGNFYNTACNDIKEYLNILYRAQHRDFHDRRSQALNLCTKYEAMLKKLLVADGRYFDLVTDGRNPQLVDCIKAFDSLWSLRDNPDPALCRFGEYLRHLQNTRNAYAHAQDNLTEAELDSFIRETTDIFIYTIAVNLDIVDGKKAAAPTKVFVYPDTQETEITPEAADADYGPSEDSAKFKRALAKLRNEKKFGGNKQWIGVYRVAVDSGLTIDGDFQMFEGQIRNMQLSKLPKLIPGYIEKNIIDAWKKPLEEWSITDVNEYRRNDFKSIKAVADRLTEILNTMKESGNER